MKKLLVPLLLIAVGLLMIIAYIAFWRLQRPVQDETQYLEAHLVSDPARLPSPGGQLPSRKDDYVKQLREPMNHRLEMTIDNKGNARVVISMNLPVQQWNALLATASNDPTQLKRNLERSMPGFLVEDFVLEQDERSRSFSFGFQAAGVCQVNKRGRWTVATGQRSPQVSHLGKRKYMLVSMDLANNIQRIHLIEFPLKARNIMLIEDVSGKARFEFDMGVAAQSYGRALLWAGLLLVCVGGIWLVILLENRRQMYEEEDWEMLAEGRLDEN